MHRRGRIAAALLGLLLGLAGRARAGEYAHQHAKTTQATPHTHRQAGDPLCASALAVPSYNQHYSGGYIGGGKATGGDGRCAHEGTWGWDYTPFRPSGRGIFLNWSHGRHYQGGTGRYATDGPHPLHAITEAAREHLGKE